MRVLADRVRGTMNGMGFRTRIRVALAVAVTTALTATALAIWSASAYHPGEAMILLGYGLPLAMIWALAGLLLYLPRRMRDAAREARVRSQSDPHAAAFLAWAESEHLTDQDRSPEA